LYAGTAGDFLRETLPSMSFLSDMDRAALNVKELGKYRASSALRSDEKIIVVQTMSLWAEREQYNRMMREMIRKTIEAKVLGEFQRKRICDALPEKMPPKLKEQLAGQLAANWEYRVQGGIKTFEFSGKNGEFGVAGILFCSQVEFPNGEPDRSVLRESAKSQIQQKMESAVSGAEPKLKILQQMAEALSLFDNPGVYPDVSRYLVAGWNENPDADACTAFSESVRTAFKTLSPDFQNALLIAAENTHRVGDFEFFLTNMEAGR